MFRSVRTGLFGAAAAVLAAGILVPATGANAVSTWSSPIKVMESSENTQDPQLVASSDGTKQFVIYRQQFDGKYLLAFVRSVDSGKTWSEPSWISAAGADAGKPSVAVTPDGSVVMLAWLSSATGALMNVKGAILSQSGVTIGDPFDISGSSAAGMAPSLGMSSDGQRATVVWRGYNSNTNNNYVATSSTTNGGTTWTTPVDLGTPSSSERTDPSVVVSADGQRAVATWSKEGAGSIFETVTSRSTDSGATWSAPQAVFGGQAGNQIDPQITMSSNGQTVHLAFIQNSSSPTQSIPFMTSSTDGGATWSTATATNVLDTTNALGRLVASADGKYVSALVVSDPNLTRKAYVVSTDSDSAWNTFTLPLIMDVGVTYVAGNYSSDGSKLVTTWVTGSVEKYTLNIGSSTDHGLNFGAQKTYSVDGQLIMFPTVAVSSDGSKIAANWRQFTTPTTNKLFVAEYGVAGPIGVTPTTGAFGRVSLGASKKLEFTVTNTSAPNATLSALSVLGNGITISGGTCAVATVVKFDASCTVEVAWKPTKVGKLVGSLTVSWDDKPDVVVPFTGTAVRAKQSLSSTVTFPSSIRTGKPTVLVKKTLMTTSGQKVTALVRCAPAASLLPAGDATLCDVSTNSKGKVTVTASPVGTRVVLTLTAPGTKKLRPFTQIKRWTVK